VLGYTEGKNLFLEIRYADDKSERLPTLARELIGLKPDVLVASNDPVIVAIRRETRTLASASRLQEDGRMNIPVQRASKTT